MIYIVYVVVRICKPLVSEVQFMNEEVTITLMVYVDKVYKESAITHAFEFAHQNLGIAAETKKLL